MIKYRSGSFGFGILFRLHGSALFKTITPAIISSVIYILLNFYATLGETDNVIFDHPYPMAALISAFTFLLSFRANFAYNRYWESFTNVHQMHSKWVDMAMEVAAFHYQSKLYDDIRPKAFGACPELNLIKTKRIVVAQRERQRLYEPTVKEIEQSIEDSVRKKTSLGNIFIQTSKRKTKKSKNKASTVDSTAKQEGVLLTAAKTMENATNAPSKIGDPPPPEQEKEGDLLGTAQEIKVVSMRNHSDEEDDNNMKNDDSTNHDGACEFARQSPFLQEAAHLISLLSAVSLSTLRNDTEGVEIPLIPFTPNEPFPHVDPDSMWADTRFRLPHLPLTITARFLLGISRTERNRTLYNAARPFRVIGGVSDSEIELLQSARGPLARVALASMWLQEFLTREYLHGSFGTVAPPILSRLYQFTSDGLLGYSQARKVAYIPFPFPHAQITSFFVLVAVGFIPVLMLTYVSEFQPVFGFFINLLTVMAFAGLNEVARELEQPFENMPNDVPLNNFQAQFNETLMTMFFGFHPDAHWEAIPTTTMASQPLPSIAKK